MRLSVDSLDTLLRPSGRPSTCREAEIPATRDRLATASPGGDLYRQRLIGECVRYDLAEVMPWVRQWRNEMNPAFGQSAADALDGYLASQRERNGITE
jgi:hypothetical protein